MRVFQCFSLIENQVIFKLRNVINYNKHHIILFYEVCKIKKDILKFKHSFNLEKSYLANHIIF